MHNSLPTLGDYLLWLAWRTELNLRIYLPLELLDTVKNVPEVPAAAATYPGL